MSHAGKPAELLSRWHRDLDAWAIPERVRQGVPASPWTLNRELFVGRAKRYLLAPSSISLHRATDALDERGDVLDVGVGAGAAALPLASRAGVITGVDADVELLAAFERIAADIDVPVRAVSGRWPEVAPEVPVADVVVCHHVLYNVPDLAPFIEALTTHARRRVVVEITDRHPASAWNPLWRHFHDLDRPDGPTAEDAIAVLVALGLNPAWERWQRPSAAEATTYEELVRTTCRRLCLPPERAGEVDDVLRGMGVDPIRAPFLGSPHRDLVTIWWAGRGT